eukprot:gnl/TRDRNA2_/TRDRNA2_34806_c0_seq1.p1 gnl/TRDRNA2_/TRDRNA2_34806_c0~~gnl/TRDRNA2_/TRDRNA2_34806_c0_seq1.p1  ORF type:complete len:791 (-),score=118.59 gnl/TRDRNA2_/TRDRNA2_34806_c0_seq1:91-2463(-)
MPSAPGTSQPSNRWEATSVPRRSQSREQDPQWASDPTLAGEHGDAPQEPDDSTPSRGSDRDRRKVSVSPDSEKRPSRERRAADVKPDAGKSRRSRRGREAGEKRDKQLGMQSDASVSSSGPRKRRGEVADSDQDLQLDLSVINSAIHKYRDAKLARSKSAGAHQPSSLFDNGSGPKAPVKLLESWDAPSADDTGPWNSLLTKAADRLESVQGELAKQQQEFLDKLQVQLVAVNTIVESMGKIPPQCEPPDHSAFSSFKGSFEPTVHNGNQNHHEQGALRVEAEVQTALPDLKLLAISSPRSSTPRTPSARSSTSRPGCNSEELGQSPANGNTVEEGGTFKPGGRRLRSEARTFRESRRKMFNIAVDRMALDVQEYHVSSFYKDEGWCQKVARDDRFGTLALIVICMNSIYIGVDADLNHEKNLRNADWGFQLCENLFCVFFTVELGIRWGAFVRKRDAFRDKWFCFDSALLATMIFETWILPFTFEGGTGIPTSIAKVMRLLRLPRLARLAREMPELVAMIKGIRRASKAVSSALILLAVLIYAFAILMFLNIKDEVQAETDYLQDRFDRLPHTMFTLLVEGTYLDGIGLLARNLFDARLYGVACLLMMFAVASALVVMNMFIGVLCQMVNAIAECEKEDSAIHLVKDNMLLMLQQLDTDCSGLISRDEIQHVLDDDFSMMVLESLDIDPNHFLAVLDMSFQKRSELTINSILERIIAMRGDKAVHIKDLTQALQFVSWSARIHQQESEERILSAIRAAGGQQASKQAGQKKNSPDKNRPRANSAYTNSS